LVVSGPNDHLLSDESAKAGSPATDRRSDRSDVAPPSLSGIESADEDIKDISKTLLGAQASTGKALNSTARMMVKIDAAEDRRAVQKKEHERQAQEARELASLSAWNKKTTTLAGIEMTNEEAQKARRRFIANEDRYADEAVRHGYIGADETDDLKRGMRRKTELQDKEGRGTITEAERTEQSQFDQSRIGRAAEQVAADIYQGKDFALDSSAELKKTRVPGNWTVARPDDLFQSAPKLTPQFQGASVAALTADDRKPPPAAPKVQASGLDF
jgi:hypothetical protein